MFLFENLDQWLKRGSMMHEGNVDNNNNNLKTQNVRQIRGMELSLQMKNVNLCYLNKWIFWCDDSAQADEKGCLEEQQTYWLPAHLYFVLWISFEKYTISL